MSGKLIVDALFCGRVDVSHSKRQFMEFYQKLVDHPSIYSLCGNPTWFGGIFSHSERALSLEAVVDRDRY